MFRIQYWYPIVHVIAADVDAMSRQILSRSFLDIYRAPDQALHVLLHEVDKRRSLVSERDYLDAGCVSRGDVCVTPAK